MRALGACHRIGLRLAARLGQNALQRAVAARKSLRAELWFDAPAQFRPVYPDPNSKATLAPSTLCDATTDSSPFAFHDVRAVLKKLYQRRSYVSTHLKHIWTILCSFYLGEQRRQMTVVDELGGLQHGPS